MNSRLIVAVHRRLELPVVVNIVAEADLAEQSPNSDVMRDVLRLQAGQARRDAIGLADRGEFKAASEKLSKVADSIEQAEGWTMIRYKLNMTCCEKKQSIWNLVPSAMTLTAAR